MSPAFALVQEGKDVRFVNGPMQGKHNLFPIGVYNDEPSYFKHPFYLGDEQGAFYSTTWVHDQSFSFEHRPRGEFTYGCGPHQNMRGTLQVVGKEKYPDGIYKRVIVPPYCPLIYKSIVLGIVAEAGINVAKDIPIVSNNPDLSLSTWYISNVGPVAYPGFIQYVTTWLADRQIVPVNDQGQATPSGEIIATEIAQNIYSGWVVWNLGVHETLVVENDCLGIFDDAKGFAPITKLEWSDQICGYANKKFDNPTMSTRNMFGTGYETVFVNDPGEPVTNKYLYRDTFSQQDPNMTYKFYRSTFCMYNQMMWYLGSMNMLNDYAHSSDVELPIEERDVATLGNVYQVPDLNNAEQSTGGVMYISNTGEPADPTWSLSELRNRLLSL